MLFVPGCRLLVKPLTLEDSDDKFRRAAALGIEIPKTEREKLLSLMDQGIVKQIGPMASKDYVEGVKVGDKIGFTKFGGKFVKDGDEQLLIINDEDVICVYKE
jgi:co-chaperonin GroES (HSP10)